MRKLKMGTTRLLVMLMAVVAVRAAESRAALCDSTHRGLIPLPELAAFYQGQPGGLYPGGMNVPPAPHDSAGLALAGSFVALNTLGQPDPNGYWVLLSVGMSNSTQEFSRFVQNLTGDTTLHDRLRIVDGAHFWVMARKPIGNGRGLVVAGVIKNQDFIIIKKFADKFQNFACCIFQACFFVVSRHNHG